MVFKRFEDIIAWQKAQEIAILTYKSFSNCRDFGFKDQICRASVSISNNVAEGFYRPSSSDFIRFLFYSVGSCNEVKSMTYLAIELNYLDETEKKHIFALCDETNRILIGLINSIKNQSKNKLDDSK